MEIQVTKGIFSTRKDVVLYHDVEVHTDGSYSFSSTVCEEAPQNGIDTILHSRGTGYQDQQDAFAFLDFLFELNDLPQVDLEMATWVFECQDREPGFYSVRYEICNQVTYIKGPGEPEFRLLPTPGSFSPTLVQESASA